MDETLRLTRRAAIVLPLFLGACASEISVPPPSRRALDAVRLDPAEATAMLNAYRAKVGLAPVRLDPELVGVAQAQANAMAAADRMAHDVNGNFGARLASAGVRAREAGENLCAGYFSLADAMTAWRRSPEHDVNLRLPAATRFGIAIAKNPTSSLGVFWAMAIAAPAPDA